MTRTKLYAAAADLGNPCKIAHIGAMSDLLDDRSVIAVSGPEARAFLQGLITNDVEKLAPERAIYAALLTPQGKILFDFVLAEGDGALLIDCAKPSRETLLKRLSMYRLRSKVTIEPRDQLVVVAGEVGAASASFITFQDPRQQDLGRRSIGARAELSMTASAPDADSDTYLSRRLALGVPEGTDFGSDRMFALDADLEELRAIDFEKGCYVGQELTARMKHRGTARKRLLPIESLQFQPLPPIGSPITAASREIGELTSAYGRRGFALVRLDRFEDAREGPIFAGHITVNIAKPRWLFP
jgi:folate-binding protein YgfZ